LEIVFDRASLETMRGMKEEMMMMGVEECND
jgi:hypothetical protein